MSELAQQTAAKAKDLAPWRPNLPWWIVLVEGIIIGGMGLLLVVNPATSSINVAIGFTVVLVVIGLLQLWAVIRNKVSERLDGIIAARGAVAVYAGLSILLMIFYDLLALEVGRVLFGLAATVFGILGLLALFGGGGKYLRGLLIDSAFFLVAGLLVLYAQWKGGEFITKGTTWLGWLSLLIGLGLIGFAFWRRQQGKKDSAPPAPIAAAVDESSPVHPGQTADGHDTPMNKS